MKITDKTIAQGVHKLGMRRMTPAAIVDRVYGPFPVTVDPHAGFPTLFQCLGVEYKPEEMLQFTHHKPLHWSGNLFAIEFLPRESLEVGSVLHDYVLQRIATQNMRSADLHHMLAWFASTPTIYRSLLGTRESFVPAQQMQFVPLGSDHDRTRPDDEITVLSFQVEAQLGLDGPCEQKSVVEYDASFYSEYWFEPEHSEGKIRHFFLAVSD